MAERKYIVLSVKGKNTKMVKFVNSVLKCFAASVVMYDNVIDKEFFIIVRPLSSLSRVPKLTNYDVADTNVVEARIDLQINIFRTE